MNDWFNSNYGNYDDMTKIVTEAIDGVQAIVTQNELEEVKADIKDMTTAEKIQYATDTKKQDKR